MTRTLNSLSREGTSTRVRLKFKIRFEIFVSKSSKDELQKNRLYLKHSKPKTKTFVRLFVFENRLKEKFELNPQRFE